MGFCLSPCWVWFGTKWGAPYTGTQPGATSAQPATELPPLTGPSSLSSSNVSSSLSQVFPFFKLWQRWRFYASFSPVILIFFVRLPTSGCFPELRVYLPRMKCDKFYPRHSTILRYCTTLGLGVESVLLKREFLYTYRPSHSTILGYYSWTRGWERFFLQKIVTAQWYYSWTQGGVRIFKERISIYNYIYICI